MLLRIKPLLLILSLTVVVSLQAKDLPNILWLTSEDNSPFLGCYGDELANSPNIDRLAKEGILFEKAYSNAAVCAPARTTLILGMYPTSLGAEHMRSEAEVPSHIQHYPHYLKKAGYYCTNNSKTDYNLDHANNGWDESSSKAHYRNRPKDSPFFAIFNYTTTHESRLHPKRHTVPMGADPEKVRVPAYIPDTETSRERIAVYYNRIHEMDKQIGERLDELEEAGLADDTIVFYYSDHGGAMPRSKRFIYESGTRVPLVVRFPKKWAHLSPFKAGSKTTEMVGFVDFAPTLLSLAGVKIPEHMHGRAFLGEQRSPETEYTYLFRARADECLDFKRGLTDGRYRYIRNYFPHLPSGQELEYLWDNPATKEWHELFKAGKTNAAQSAFFLPAPAEELFDTLADPDEVKNLANDPAHRKTLLRLRKENQAHLKRTLDTGFIPEALLVEWSRMADTPPYELVREGGKYPIDEIIEVVDGLVTHPKNAAKTIEKALNSPNPIIQYWGVIHCLTDREAAEKFEDQLVEIATSNSATAVRLAAVEYLARSGKMDPRPTVLRVMNTDANPLARLQAVNILEADEVYGKYPADHAALEASLKRWPALNKRTTKSWVHRYQGYPAQSVAKIGRKQ